MQKDLQGIVAWVMWLGWKIVPFSTERCLGGHGTIDAKTNEGSYSRSISRTRIKVSAIEIGGMAV